MADQIYRIDNVLWKVSPYEVVQPLCPVHHLRMRPLGDYIDYAQELECADCKKPHYIPRGYSEEKIYVLDRIASKVFKGMKILNLDDEAVPMAEARLSSADDKFFVTGILTRSKVGLRLVLYAGEKGKKEKTQIFVEPEIKRLAFDQNDLHPAEVFIKIEGTFNDGTRTNIETGE